MKRKVEDVWNSFKDGKQGLGAKRLTAFAFMCLIVWLHLNYGDKYAEYFYTGDCLMIGFMLGLVTASQLIELKNLRTTKE